METDKKIRLAVNYFRKNTLKKYYHMWMKYTTIHREYLKKKIIGKQRNRSFDSKPSIQFDCSTLDSTDSKTTKTINVDNVANVREEKFELVEAVSLVPKSDITNLNEIINDEIKKQSTKLWILLLSRYFKLWKKYSCFLINKNHGKILIVNVKRSQNSRKKIFMVHRALLLLKTAWEIWYLQYINKSIL